jgi:P-type E1-E2 ATPase
VRERAGEGIAGWVDGVHWTIASEGPGRIEVRGLGAIALADHVRDDARSTVAAIHATGARTVLLSGDHPEVAKRFGEAAGIEHVVARAQPDEKVQVVASLGSRVLFVGDGLNDGPALAAASVGIAMGTGAASSILVADGVLIGQALAPVARALAVARTTRRVVRGNTRRAVAYNVAAVALALAGLVNPLVAAVLMPLSSALVIRSTRRIAAP